MCLAWNGIETRAVKFAGDWNGTQNKGVNLPAKKRCCLDFFGRAKFSSSRNRRGASTARNHKLP
jgi:hypothetical protein